MPIEDGLSEKLRRKTARCRTFRIFPEKKDSLQVCRSSLLHQGIKFIPGIRNHFRPETESGLALEGIQDKPEVDKLIDVVIPLLVLALPKTHINMEPAVAQVAQTSNGGDYIRERIRANISVKHFSEK